MLKNDNVVVVARQIIIEGWLQYGRFLVTALSVVISSCFAVSFGRSFFFVVAHARIERCKVLAHTRGCYAAPCFGLD